MSNQPVPVRSQQVTVALLDATSAVLATTTPTTDANGAVAVANNAAATQVRVTDRFGNTRDRADQLGRERRVDRGEREPYRQRLLILDGDVGCEQRHDQRVGLDLRHADRAIAGSRRTARSSSRPVELCAQPQPGGFASIEQSCAMAAAKLCCIAG